MIASDSLKRTSVSSRNPEETVMKKTYGMDKSIDENSRDLAQKKAARVFWLMIFAIYLAVLAYFLFFSEYYGRGAGNEMRYNLEPLVEIKRFLVNWQTLGIRTVIVNVIGNVVAFIPFGLLIPAVSSKKSGFFKVIILTFLASLVVESIQLVTRVGIFDVDDLILNTFGGAVGYIIYAAHKYMKNEE